MTGRTIPYKIFCPVCGVANTLRSGERLQCQECGTFISLRKDIATGEVKAGFDWLRLTMLKEARDD